MENINKIEIDLDQLKNVNPYIIKNFNYLDKSGTINKMSINTL